MRPVSNFKRLTIIAIFTLLLTVLVTAKLESETAQTTEENVKDKGGLLEEEYAGIDFSHEENEEEEIDERYLPQNMLSVVFTSKTKCFYEEVTKGSILRGAWFLTTSGTSPISVKVKHITTTPETVVYEEDHEEDTGGFTLEAQEAGTYSYCFDHINFPSDTDLVLTFAVDVSAPSSVKTKDGGSAAKPDHIYPLQRSTSNLYNTMQSLVSELEVILLRIDRHVQTQDSTETRVSLLTFVETLAIAGITAFQIYFVRRLVNKSKQWV